MAIKVVTDSTSDLPPELAKELDITVVPLNVMFGTETYKDNVDITADEFYERLQTGGVLPKTSQPSPGDFAQVYDEVGKDADGILSAHISAKLSGTYNSAVQAVGETEAACPIEVVDTAQVSMALGLVAVTAARAARDGATLEQARDAAVEAAGRARCFAAFDTLEYLEKGGRIGKASAMVGSMLKLKPMIVIRDGEVQPLAKPRTTAKAVARLQQVVRDLGSAEALCVMYSTTPDVARKVADDLADVLPEGAEPMITRFGPVIGTYAGPGAVGVGVVEAGS